MSSVSSSFSAGLSAIRSSALGAKAVNAPWFVLLGNVGAGKTTALAGSGLALTPPLNLANPQPTAAVSLHATAGAVFVDTAGSLAHDSAGWKSLLTSIQSAGAHVRGVIVCISIAEFSGDPSALDNQLTHLMARITEAAKAQRVPPALYVFFTQLDRLQGFNEYFRSFKEVERQQTLGVTLPFSEKPADLPALLVSRFDEVYSNVQVRSVSRLLEERVRAVREQVFQFPNWMHWMRDGYSRVVSKLFNKQSGLAEGVVRVRGVYVSGVGTSAMGEREGFFLRTPFVLVMVPDGEDIAASDRGSPVRRALRFGVSGLLFAAAATMGVFSSCGYSRGTDTVDETKDALDDVARRRAADKGANANLWVGLDKLQGVAAKLRGAGDSVDIALGLDPRASLAKGVEATYRDTLRTYAVSPYFSRAESGLREFVKLATKGSVTAVQRNTALDDLRTYLLMTTPRAAGEPAFNEKLKGEIRGRVAADWAKRRNATDRHTGMINGQIAGWVDDWLAGKAVGFARDTALVTSVRAQLVHRDTPSVDAMEIEGEAKNFGESVVTLAGPDATMISSSASVKGIYTQRGWTQLVYPRLVSVRAQLTGEPWVLGGDVSTRRETLDEEIVAFRAEYFSRYEDQWKTFLQALHVRQTTNASDLLALLDSLLAAKPLLTERLFTAIARQVHLTEPDDGASAEALPRARGSHEVNKVEPAFNGYTAFGAQPLNAGPDAEHVARPLDSWHTLLTVLAEGLRAIKSSAPAAVAMDPAARRRRGPVAVAPAVGGITPELAEKIQRARLAFNAALDASDPSWRPALNDLMVPVVDAAMGYITPALPVTTVAAP